MITGSINAIFANIDYSQIKKDKKPLLAAYIRKNKYTSAKEYWGLGYTIIKCPEIDGEKTNYQLILLTNNHICFAGQEN